MQNIAGGIVLILPAIVFYIGTTNPTMMRKKLLSAACFLIGLFSYGQSPVQWTFTDNKVADKTYELKMTAVVASPWHIYSQATPEGGPVPTKVTFNKNPLILLQGSPEEKGNVIKKYEDVFNVDVIYFDRKVEFVQRVKLKGNAKTKLSGTVEYMVCNDTQCLPPTQVPFNFDLK